MKQPSTTSAQGMAANLPFYELPLTLPLKPLHFRGCELLFRDGCHLHVLSPQLQAGPQYFTCDFRAAAHIHSAHMSIRKWCSLLDRPMKVARTQKLCKLGQECPLWANDTFGGQDLELTPEGAQPCTVSSLACNLLLGFILLERANDQEPRSAPATAMYWATMSKLPTSSFPPFSLSILLMCSHYLRPFLEIVGLCRGRSTHSLLSHSPFTSTPAP